MAATSTTFTLPVNATGKGLRRLLHGKSPKLRAKAAAGLVAGKWQLVDPLPAQAARLCQVDSSRVGRELEARSDRYVDKLIKRVGAERVMAGLDRVTRPANGNGTRA